MIDEQSSASEHDYASDRSAIGAGQTHPGKQTKQPIRKYNPNTDNLSKVELYVYNEWVKSWTPQHIIMHV